MEKEIGKNKINYIIGDVFESKIEGPIIIAHICNDIGAWGKGFVLSLSRRWKLPETKYKIWYKSNKKFKLGEVQFVEVQENTIVANMISQRGIRKTFTDVPMQYDALIECLDKVSKIALETGSTVLMPRIGCGLAGGKWENIYPIIEDTLIKKGIKVFVFDLE